MIAEAVYTEVLPERRGEERQITSSLARKAIGEKVKSNSQMPKKQTYDQVVGPGFVTSTLVVFQTCDQETR